ncbi:MAG TPA: hypothetical protein VKR32_04890 [Puia sp.]|nr:hypothetical protein [Puia sp.]
MTPKEERDSRTHEHIIDTLKLHPEGISLRELMAALGSGTKISELCIEYYSL